MSLVGHGADADADGSIVAYEWSSDLDGVLSTNASFTTSDLSWGSHIISLKVQDNLGAWSQAATQSLTVSHSVIVDNLDANTAKTGTWSTSSATGFYGTNSVWSRDGATFSWLFTPPEAGFYEISMWSTYAASRPTNAQVDIENADGTVNGLRKPAD